MDDVIFSSSSCCCDEEECGLCGCFIAGCKDCTVISCGSDENGDSCDCGQGPVGPSGIPDGCTGVCSTSTDDDVLCNADCPF